MGKINRYAQGQLASSMVGTPGVDNSASIGMQNLQGGVDSAYQMAGQEAQAIGQLGSTQLGLDRQSNADIAQMMGQSVASANAYQHGLQQDIQQAGNLAAQTMQVMRYRQAQANAARDAYQKILDRNNADVLGVDMLSRRGRELRDAAQTGNLDNPDKGVEDFRKSFEQIQSDIDNDKTLNANTKNFLTADYARYYAQFDADMTNWAKEQHKSNTFAAQDAVVTKAADFAGSMPIDIEVSPEGVPSLSANTVKKFAENLNDVAALNASKDGKPGSLTMTRGMVAANKYIQNSQEKVAESFIRNLTNVNPTLAKTLLTQDKNLKDFFGADKLDSLVTNANSGINTQLTEEKRQFEIESFNTVRNLEQAEAAAQDLIPVKNKDGSVTYVPDMNKAQQAFDYVSAEYRKMRELPPEEQYRQRELMKHVESSFKTISATINRLNKEAESAKVANVTIANTNAQTEYTNRKNKIEENYGTPESIDKYNEVKNEAKDILGKIDEGKKKYGAQAGIRSGFTVQDVKALNNKLNESYNKGLLNDEEYKQQQARINEIASKITPDEFKSTTTGKPFKPVKPVTDLFGLYVNYGVDLHSGATPPLYKAFGVKEGSQEARDLDTMVNKELRGLADQNKDNFIDENITAQQMAQLRRVAETRIFKRALEANIQKQNRKVEKPVIQTKPYKKENTFAVPPPPPTLGPPPPPGMVDVESLTPEQRKQLGL